MDVARRLLRRLLFSDLPWLRDLTWKRVGWTFALAVALSVSSTPSAVLDTVGGFAAPIAVYAEGFLFYWFPTYLVALVVLMLCGTVADNLPLRGWSRTAAFATALALGTLAVAPEHCLLLSWIYGVGCEGKPLWRAFLTAVSSGGASVLTLGLVIGAAWLGFRRDAALATRLHAAEMDRIGLQRRTLEAGLTAMQARIDPALLLGTLGEVAIRCENDPANAERMVDELVDYLRAALPDVRDEGSTLGRELRITRAWLDLATLRSGGRIRCAIDAPASLLSERMPPTVLMPLLAGAIDQESPDAGPVAARIDASLAGERLQVRLTCTGHALRMRHADPIVAELRERLGALYGAAAVLGVDIVPGERVVATLELPRESAGAAEADRIAAGDADRAAALRLDPAYQGA